MVTGGSEGIGAAVAAAAAARGAAVTILARRPDRLRAQAAATGAHAVVADVTDPAAVVDALRSAVSVHGPVDVLVHCAGTALPGRFLDVPLDEFAAQAELNLVGTVNVLRAVLPAMVDRGSGHVVVTSSTAAVVAVPGYTAYAAAKAGVAALAAALRYEVEPRGVRVSVLYPPDTRTPGFDAENLRKPPETAAVSAGVKPVSPDRVAAAVLDGVDRRHAVIALDPLTRVAVRFGGALDPLLRPLLRRTIRRAVR